MSDDWEPEYVVPPEVAYERWKVFSDEQADHYDESIPDSGKIDGFDIQYLNGVVATLGWLFRGTDTVYGEVRLDRHKDRLERRDVESTDG